MTPPRRRRGTNQERLRFYHGRPQVASRRGASRSRRGSKSTVLLAVHLALDLGDFGIGEQGGIGCQGLARFQILTQLAERRQPEVAFLGGHLLARIAGGRQGKDAWTRSCCPVGSFSKVVDPFPELLGGHR